MANILPLRSQDFTIPPSTLAEIENAKGKKALITICHWGTGHIVAGNNLEKQLLAQGFQVVKLDVNDPVREKWDAIYKLTFGKLKTENLIDLCLKLGQFQRFFGHFGLIVDSTPEHFEYKRESEKRFIEPLREEIKKINPDVIIPVTRMLLDPTIRAAQGGVNGRQIPVVQVQTDAGSDTDGDYRRFPYPLHKVCVMSDHDICVGKIKKLVPEEQIYSTGYPVKDLFLLKPTEAEKTSWREKWKVTNGKTVVFASGGAGIPSKKPEQLLLSKTPYPEDLHVFVLCVDNTDYFNHLTKLMQLPVDQRNPCVFLHPLKRIPPSQVRELFSISSLVVGKPGGGTSAEIFYTRTKLLTDISEGEIAWEKPNFDALQLCNMAESFKSDEEFFDKFNMMISNQKPINEEERAKFANPQALENIVSVVNQAIAEARELNKKGIWQPFPKDYHLPQNTREKAVQKFFDSMQQAPLGHQPNFLENLGVALTKPFSRVIKLWNNSECGLIKNIVTVALAIFTSPFMLLGLGLNYLGKKMPHKINPLSDAILDRSPPQIIDDLYDGLKLLNQELSSRNIPYLTAGETLKGLVDRQGLFPWDKKAFIKIRDKDVPYLTAEFKESMKEKGFELTGPSFGRMVLKPRAQNREVGQVELRICQQRIDGHWEYVNTDENPNDIATDQEFHAAKKGLFGPNSELTLNVPFNSKENLFEVYGKKWQEEAFYTKDSISLTLKVEDPDVAQGHRWSNRNFVEI